MIQPLRYKDTFNTENTIDQHLEREQEILADLNFLHESLKKDNNGFVRLDKLSVDDFSLSEKLFNAAHRVTRLHIRAIPPEPDERLLQASVACALP